MPSIPHPLELVGGLLLSALIAAIGYRRDSLTGSGVVGAIVTGTLFFGLGGWEWGSLLVAFFVSSSALSHYRQNEKAGLAEKFDKGHRRDLGQALANAGVGSLLAILGLWWSPPLLYAAAVGTMAAVNADTWATELGVLSRYPPRMITTGREVEVGSSGGVTLLGQTAALGGAAFISLLGAGATLLLQRELGLAVAILAGGTLGGLGGSLFDSLLGATVQAIYWCDQCGKETERHLHRCGATTHRVRGYAWLTNDGVNFVSSAVGGAVSIAASWVLWGLLG
jgi:uncharacterized protein (TIGR00297 family)